MPISSKEQLPDILPTEQDREAISDGGYGDGDPEKQHGAEVASQLLKKY